jgi:hypothetical protein
MKMTKMADLGGFAGILAVFTVDNSVAGRRSSSAIGHCRALTQAGEA